MPDGERHQFLVMALDPEHAARRCRPPLLGEQERLMEHVERPMEPFVAVKTAVACRWLDVPASLPGPGEPALDVIARQLTRVLEREQPELHLLARRDQQIDPPVPSGKQG